MKKLFLLLFTLSALSFPSCAQKPLEDANEDPGNLIDNISDMSPSAAMLAIYSVQNVTDKYKLYPTKNMWTFLKLDTQTGKVWQLQYTVNDDNAGEWIVNDRALNFDNLEISGRFELYPTENFYNFLLLDKSTGNVWQVQWSTNEDNRGIVNIISLFSGL